MATSDLRPCPHCGSDELFSEGKRMRQVRCGACDMLGPVGEWNGAADEWNALPRREDSRTLPTTTEGTSDRVMLAGLAMQALVASVPSDAFDEMDSDPESERLCAEHRKAVAWDAVRYADALLVELGKGGEDDEA